jgi:hypothetical protein
MSANELDSVRAELKDIRYLTEAVLAELVGADAIHGRVLFARIDSDKRRERAGTPLRSVRLQDRVRQTLTWRMDVVTLEDLAQHPRREIAALDGIGRKTMQKLDLAFAEHELTWREQEINDESMTAAVR